MFCDENAGYSLNQIGGDSNDQKVACIKYIPQAQDSCERAGNPIMSGLGIKLQQETDYVFPQGGYRIQRTYRSDRGWLHTATDTGVVDYSGTSEMPDQCLQGSYLSRVLVNGTAQSQRVPYCFPLIGVGKTEYDLQSADGRIVRFTGDASAPTSNGEVNAKLAKRVIGGSTVWVASNEDNSLSVFGLNGLLLSRTTADGKSYTMSYSSNPTALQSVTEWTSRQATFTYDQYRRVTSMTNPKGEITQYAYDGASSNCGVGGVCNNLTSITLPGASTRVFHYNELQYTENISWPRALTGITDENASRYAIFKYNSSGRAISTEHANGADRYLVSASSYPTVTDPLGSQRQMSFTTTPMSQKLSYQSQPAGAGCAAASSAISYDPQGNPTSRDDFTNKRSCYSYDLARNLETVRLEGLASSAACPAPLGSYTIAAPAPGSNVTQRKTSTLWHPDWRLEVRRAEPKRISTWVYNGQPDPTAAGAVASCAPATAVLPDGKPIAVLCKQIEQATTDATGSAGFGAAASGTPRIWSYTYNGYGQVLTADGPRTDAGIADKTTYTYHAATTSDVMLGDLASVSNAAGHVVTYPKYDRNGRLLRMVDANGATTDYSYHPRGWLLSSTVTPAGVVPGSAPAAGVALINRYDYDAAGQLKKATAPDGSFVAYSYDAAHRLIALSDAAGNTISYTLDAMGNRIQEQSKDPAGTLARQVSRVIDALNRVQQVTGAAQ
jgi:YD repeat-containing protein